MKKIISLLTFGFSHAVSESVHESLLHMHGCAQLNPSVEPKVFWFSTHAAVGLEITGSGLRADDRLVLVRKGTACSNESVSDQLDTEIQSGCPGACEWFGWPDAYGRVGIELVTTSGLGDDGVGIVGIQVLNSSRIRVRFNESAPASLAIGDRLVIDTSTITCSDQATCALVTGLLDLGGNCRRIHGNAITNISGDTVELSSSIPIPPSDCSFETPIRAWERMNRFSTKPELTRLSPVVDLRLCLLSRHTGAVVSVGSVSFLSAPEFERLEVVPASAAADVAVPAKLILQGLVPQAGKVKIKLVLPFVTAFDIHGSDLPAGIADGNEHSVPCESFITNMEWVDPLPRIESCSLTQFEVHRKDLTISLNDTPLPIRDLNMSILVKVGKSVSSSLVGQVHVFHSSNPFNLLQFGFITLGSTPGGLPGLSASRWAPFSGLSISSSTSFVDLRRTNGTFSIVLSGGPLEISAIRNGTVIRLIGWKDMKVSAVECFVCSSRSRLEILESMDSDSIKFQYTGPNIWGSIRVTLNVISVGLLPPAGFLPMRLFGEILSETGIDLTRSVGAQLWCSPTLEDPSIITGSLESIRWLFVNEPVKDVQVRFSFPWIIPGGSVIFLEPPDNIEIIDDKMYVLPQWSVHQLVMNVSLVGTGVSETLPIWRFRVQILSSVEIGPVLFSGSLPWVTSHLDYVRIERTSPNALWVWFASGQSNSRLGKSISISPRIGSWSGRRTCLVLPVDDGRYYTTNSRIGGGAGCVMDSSGDVIVDAKRFRAGTRYLFKIEFGDDRWNGQVLDLVVRDQHGAPLEGESRIPVVGQQQGCARILQSFAPSVWFPNTVGELNISLWLVPNVTVVDLSLDGGQLVWEDMGASLIETTHGNRTLKLSRQIRIRVRDSADYSQSQSLVVTCENKSSSRALLPPVAEVFDIQIEPLSWIVSRNITIDARFKTNFDFSDAWIESNDLTPNRLDLGKTSSRVSAGINQPSNRTEVRLVLVVDGIRIPIPNPIILYGPLSDFHVLSGSGPGQVLIQLNPRRACRRPCKVSVYGPIGTEFIHSTSSSMEEVVLDVNQTIPTGVLTNLTLGVSTAVAGGMWRVVVGSDQVGEYSLTLPPKGVTDVQVLGRCNGIDQLNVVEVYFNSSGSRSSLSIDLGNSGFLQEGIKTLSSQQGHITMLVRNPPSFKSQSNWTLSVDGLLVEIPSPVVISRLQSLRAVVTGRNLTLYMQTSDQLIPGDVLQISLPDALSIACPSESTHPLLDITCRGISEVSVRVREGSVVISSTSELVLDLKMLPEAYQEDLNVVTVHHVRHGVEVIACGSILGPKITASIPSVSIQSVGKNQSAGSVADISISFNATFSGTSVELTAVSPIGFDFRNVSPEGRGLKHSIRITHAFRKNEVVELKLFRVQLPPFPGGTVFSLKTYNGDRIVSEQLVHGFSIPSKLRIDSVGFSGNPRFGGELVHVWMSVDGLACRQVQVDAIPLFGPVRNLTVNASEVRFSTTTPLEPVSVVDMGISCAENGTVVATNDGEGISLIGKVAEDIEVSISPLSRVGPNMLIRLNISIQTRWMYDSVEVVPPDGFSLHPEASRDLHAFAVKTPRETPTENIWEIKTKLSNGTVVGSGRVFGFEIFQLTDAFMEYPSLPWRQVPAPLLMAVKFKLTYPTSIVRLVRLTLPPQTHIVAYGQVTFEHIPVSTWDSTQSILNLWVNETMLARDYAFSLHVIQFEIRNTPPTNVSLELLGPTGEVVDACYTLQVKEVQYGFPVAPAMDSTLFTRDDQSSVLNKNLSLTTQETSSILVAQLSSFREVFPFRLFGSVLVRNISQIRIRFPDRVVLNRAWMHKDPVHVGFMGSREITSNIETVECSPNSLSVTLSFNWTTDIASPDFYMSVPVTLPQNEPLPAFNFYQVSFADNLNRTVSTFVFKAHRLSDKPSTVDPAMVFVGNSTSASVRTSSYLLFPVLALVTI